jgi:DegV family protein with EDD domain
MDAAPPPNVAVVADTSACLPQALIDEYGITLVPLAYLIDGELYRDGQLTTEEFQEKLEGASTAPTTTVPAPGEFLDVFRRLKEVGREQILCLTLSSRYSGTHSAALNGAELASREMPGVTVRVVDTGGLAMTHGFAVLAAARAACGGAELEEAADVAMDVGGRAHLVGALDTMRFLAKSGRVPWIVNWAASLLDIKPVLAAARDEVRSHGRPRTMRNAVNRIMRYLEERAGPPEQLHVAVMHFGAPERAAELAERVQERFCPAELLVTEFTPVMSVHTGPGFVGLAFYSDAPVVEAEKVAPSRRLERDVGILEEALGPLPAAVARPALVMLSGLPGAGKSHLARELARRHPFAVVESDRLRKALVRRPDYGQKESARLFAACHELMDRLLSRGVSCLFDATNLREEHRRPVYAIADRRGARLVVVAVTAPAEVAHKRLERRALDPLERSDADVRVYEEMTGDAEPIGTEYVVVDSTEDVAVEAGRVLAALAEREPGWVRPQ